MNIAPILKSLGAIYVEVAKLQATVVGQVTERAVASLAKLVADTIVKIQEQHIAALSGPEIHGG